MSRASKYKDEYCEMLIKHMGQGFPFVTFASIIGVNESTLHRWLHKKKDFVEAKKIGENQCYLHYMKMGQALAMGKIKGNVTAWIFMMKNICHWRDHNNTQIGIGIQNSSNGVSLEVNADETPTFEVEVNERGKFKTLSPRKVN